MPPKPANEKMNVDTSHGPAFFHTVHGQLQPVPRNPVHSYWIPSILFVSFLALVILRVFDRNKLSQVINAFLRQSSVGLLFREEYGLTNRASLLLILNFILVTPLFIYQVLPYFGVNAERISGFTLYLIMLGGLSAIYLVKITGIRFFGFIFDVSEAAGEYAFNVLLFNKMLGLLLFPVVVLLAFAVQVPVPAMIWIGLCLWSLVLVYRVLRMVLIGISSASVSMLYLFLYLCTLEILPFVVTIKLFITQIG